MRSATVRAHSRLCCSESPEAPYRSKTSASGLPGALAASYSSSTTVVNSMTVRHHVRSDEGGGDGADGGSEDGEVVGRGAGGGERMPLGAFRPLRGARAGARLSARIALRNRAKERLAVG